MEQIPTKIGKYEIVRVLGSGATGTVYLGTDPEGAQRALKVLPATLRDDSSIFARFRIEIDVLQSLNHANIVKTYEVSQESGQRFYVMEYLPGGSLADRIKRLGALPMHDALDITVSLCSALEHAHTAGVVHRDVKPANILFDENGRAKLVDFGIAKLAQTNGVTATRQVMGTVEYMSPEQAAGAGIDSRSDIYSLGIVLYEMLTGRVPFRGQSVAAVLKNHQYAMPESPQAWNDSIPPWLNQLVLSMIEKEPDRRPQSAAAVAEEIERGRRSREPIRCPQCGNSLEDGQVLCVQCGTNVRTGERYRVASERTPRAVRRLLIVAAAVGIAGVGAIFTLRNLELPREDSITRAELQQEHLSLGERFLRAGDLKNAEQEFHRAIELDRNTELATAAAKHLKMIEQRSSTADKGRTETDAR